MIIPVILSGGAGTRLWPISRQGRPKPFMKLADGESLLLKTYRNTAPAVALAAHHIADRHGSDALMLVLAADHLIQVLEQLAQHAPDVATQVDACWQALEAQTKISGHCGLIAASSFKQRQARIPA